LLHLTSLVPFLHQITAFVNILPTLHEIGANMGNNFNQWGQRRLMELVPTPDTKPPEEAAKLTERLEKFKARMAFTDTFRGMPQRRRSSFNNKK
jgi:hypothetical protein